ncbi:hypothetical protein PAPHI01_1806 [Pancytospora philotis]|nr:hypothetical protein PAPHI01_1806 [Pancytospora philotis]
MESGIVILLSLLLFIAIVRSILMLSQTKALCEYEEYAIVAIGWVFFMYISWLVIYMANINPFIDPVAVKGS